MLKRLGVVMVFLLWGSITLAQEPIDVTDCVDVPYGFEASCGYVTLPQDYERPSRGAVQIYYTQIKSQSQQPHSDPIVYLVGGPGSSGTQLLRGSFRSYLRPFAQTRDVIVIDQRGTGLSTPSLYCTEAVTQLGDILQSTLYTHAETMLDMLTDCHDRLSARDIQLDTFHSANNARDIVQVLLSLGYERWNLIGVSDGSRLALTMMRDYPDHLRSVILDSVYPLQADLYVDAYYHGERALDVLFDACAEDVACNTAYPNLERVFYALFDRLNDEPIVVEFTPPRYHDLSVEISGNRLYDWVFSWLYSVDSIPSIPHLIYELDAGKTVNIVRKGTVYESSLTMISLGMHYTVQCQEEYISASHRDYVAIIEAFPHLDAYMRYPVEGMATVDRLCDMWQAEPRDPIANSPVYSDIPTLLLSGNFDPITPPAYAESVHATLSQSYNVVFPYVSHGVLRSDRCAVDIAQAFIGAPDDVPDRACIAETQPMQFD